MNPRSFHITGAANAATVLTLNAPGNGVSHRLQGFSFSYSGIPAAGLLTIQQGGTTIYEQAITSSGLGFVPHQATLDTNTSLVITLAAGGSGIVGRLSASVAQV